MDDTPTCLICLAPAPKSASVLQCVHDHPMHVACFTTMLREMGRFRCPYCNGAIPFVIHPRGTPTVWIFLEHTLYGMILIMTYLFSAKQRTLWRLNLDILRIRSRTANILPIRHALGEFRRMVLTSAINLLPALLLGSRLLTSTDPWGRRDLWEIAGCLSLLSQH